MEELNRYILIIVYLQFLTIIIAVAVEVVVIMNVSNAAQCCAVSQPMNHYQEL